MPSRRPRSATILIAAIVALVSCAVVAAELPELLSLTDSIANDFTVRNTSTSHTTTRLIAANYDSVQPGSKYGEQVGWTSIFEDVKSSSVSLFILLRTLRT